MQDFIFANENEDEGRIVLSHKEILGVPSSLIAQQIKGRKKAKNKLPALYAKRGVVYPLTLNLEQCSSETTARFKNRLLSDWQIKSVLDLTGGFGIDSFFFSGDGRNVDYVEPDPDLFSIVKYNHSLFGRNINHHLGTAETFLDKNKGPFDLVFLDPSRRANGKKVIRFTDCEPNVVALQDLIFRLSPNLLLKAAPLLDIQQGLRELSAVKTVYVLSVDNECRELLFHCERGFAGEPIVQCDNLHSSGLLKDNPFMFSFAQEQLTSVEMSQPLTFLYEANASILKAGAFKTIAKKYALFKLALHTHLYTSHQFINGFPGRVFEVLESVKPDKGLHSKFSGGYANIITRNYPLSVEEIKKKTGLKEGGDLYLVGCSDSQNKFLLLCKRLS